MVVLAAGPPPEASLPVPVLGQTSGESARLTQALAGKGVNALT